MKLPSLLTLILFTAWIVSCDSRTNKAAHPALPASPAEHSPLQPGDPVPDFAFTTHDGKAATFSSLRPRAVLMTFIFTRCTMMEFCPRLSLKFRETREALDPSPHRDSVELLSITLDPQNDTPEALATYAGSFGARPGRWTFARCEPDVLSGVKRQFGVRAEATGPNGSIEHNLITALVAPDGRLRRIWEGNAWTAAEIIAELEAKRSVEAETAANSPAR